ncbi:tetratricopeptide repeat protein 8 [Ixodes scapularis]|nr:tetratricopeptide repeat protein 8 [Ixodes scapularis]
MASSIMAAPSKVADDQSVSPEPFQRALSLYRRRRFAECADACQLLPHIPQAHWLQLRALTQQAWLDELELDDEPLAQTLLDDHALAQTARPGTSLRAPGPTASARPLTREGRPVTGVRRRPQSRATTSGAGIERVLRTAAGGARTARVPSTARPASSAGPLLDLGRLARDAGSWASQPACVSKPLFRYLYHERGDVRQALDLASQRRGPDCCGWWALQRGRCFLRLGMPRDAEQQFRTASEAGDPMPRAHLWLAKLQLQLDQPLAALETYRRALDKFPDEAAVIAPMARVYEGLHDLQRSAKLYKDLLVQDAVHVEAIACVATHHFYADQPELALRFYRRLLQLGVPTAELYNNLALCCFYAQQYDVALTCFERALSLAGDQLLADIWYNLGHVALSAGDKTLAARCFRLSLVHNNDHAESYNNLGVIEVALGNTDKAKAHFITAGELAPELYEPHYNQALLLEEAGDLQGCARAASQCSQHAAGKALLSRVQALFRAP